MAKQYLLKPKSKHSEIAFFLLFIVIAYFTFLVFQPFFHVIFLSIVAAIFIAPLYKWIEKKFKLPYWLNIFITFLIVLIVILTPVVLVISAAVKQGEELLSTVDIEALRTTLDKLVELMRTGDVQATNVPDNVVSALHDLLVQVVNAVKNSLGTILRASVAALTNFMIFIIVTFSLVPNMKKLGKFVKETSPLGNKLTNLYLTRSKAITMNIVKGSFVVAFIQALLAALALWVLGIPFVFFWFVIMFFSSGPRSSNPLGLWRAQTGSAVTRSNVITRRPANAFFMVVIVPNNNTVT